MRYKEFNRIRVLEKCIPLFWKNGFTACAISDIVKETLVNRFSLYEEYNNKEGVLHGALQLYHDQYASENLKVLEKEGPAREVLKAFYFSFLNRNDHLEPGCFFIHIGSELADSDPVVKELLKKYLGEIESLFILLLEKDQETSGEANFYARQLIGLFCTSMSFCLIHSEKERINHITNGINIILRK